MVKIVIDAMGAEGGLEIAVNGAKRAYQKRNGSIEIMLIGDKQRLEEFNLNGIGVVNATEVIGMDEEPLSAVKKKKDSSIVVATRMVREGDADIFLSPGNTGATVAASAIFLKRVDKLKPAIATTIPNKNGRFTILLDSGANSECNENDLFYFSFMGSLFYTYLFGEKYPAIGLINMGTEHYKGPEKLRKADAMLKGTDLDYKGFIEGNDIVRGTVDVAVCDGYTGNVLLKGTEGAAKVIMSTMEEEFRMSLLRKVGAAILKYAGAFDSVKKRLNPETYGGGLLLGLESPVMIAHGASSEKSIENATIFAAECVEVCKKINPFLREAKEKYGY